MRKDAPWKNKRKTYKKHFLNNARKDKTFLTIYLMSGVKLSGRIKSFDKYSVILETNNQEQLIFKHAISTVVVSKPFHSSRPHIRYGRPAGTHAAPGAPYDAENLIWPDRRNRAAGRITRDNARVFTRDARTVHVPVRRSHRPRKAESDVITRR